jgi:hypothetical protein
MMDCCSIDALGVVAGSRSRTPSRLVERSPGILFMYAGGNATREGIVSVVVE